MTSSLPQPSLPPPSAEPGGIGLPEALARMTEAEDTLRALGAGEIDAFVVSDSSSTRRVFTLTTADRPYRLFVENMRDGAATLSEGGMILYANDRLIDLLRRDRPDVVGSQLTTFVSAASQVDLQHVREPGGVSAAIEVDLLDVDGRLLPVLVGISPLEVDGGTLSCLTFTDLTEQKAQEREIERLQLVQTGRLCQLQAAQAALIEQATHDGLTGLPNRTLIVDRIEQALIQAEQSGRCTAVFFVDLDRFKLVNDNRGHAVGDDVLRAVGESLASVLHPTDTLARIGGDEFAVLAHDVDNQLHAVDIGLRLLEQLRNHSLLIDQSESVAASIGVAVSVAGRGTAEIMLHEADMAMYSAKSQGGDRIELFDADLGLLAAKRIAARRMLQSALDDRRLVAFYQPILHIATGAIAGFEALARITEPGGRIVPPSEFIPAAEDSGLIVPMGQQILSLACRQASEWNPRFGPSGGTSVAVNLSARQFGAGDLTAMVQRELERSGLAPHQLHLELTETATIDLRRDVLDQLGRIRDLGVEIGLDDFGTGYGSLTHLRRLPLSFVKIDQTFVAGIGRVKEDERIVSAVISLADNLGLRSIAEGVETSEQLSLLRELGCDQAQGYLFARPMPAADVDHVRAENARLPVKRG